MSFELFRTIAGIIGLPVASRDDQGNLVVTDNTGAVPMGKGTPTPITGSRALTDADDNCVLVNKTASAYTLTVPAGLRAGFNCTIIQGSTGVLTLAASGGAVISSADSFVKTKGAGTKLGLQSWDTDKYALSGNGATA